MTNDGRIYRVVGNLESQTHFLGYNIYSPHPSGDRQYRGVRYAKNYVEDAALPADVLHTYHLIAAEEVIEYHDPRISAQSQWPTFKSTIWHDLYTELIGIFGRGSVGIFGSSMFGLHLTPGGLIRKDVDFVIDGLANVQHLRRCLPEIRRRLGFTVITEERQLQQYYRYQKVFRNVNNSIRPVIARRWTGLQLSDQIVTTIRIRDPSVRMPIRLISQSRSNFAEVVMSGRVVCADNSNLFPRKFGLVTRHGYFDIYIFWWKFSTPVRDDDTLTLCGNLIAGDNPPAVCLTNFVRHWLRIDD